MEMTGLNGFMCCPVCHGFHPRIEIFQGMDVAKCPEVGDRIIMFGANGTFCELKNAKVENDDR